MFVFGSDHLSQCTHSSSKCYFLINLPSVLLISILDAFILLESYYVARGHINVPN